MNQAIIAWSFRPINTPSSDNYNFVKPVLIFWNGQSAVVLDVAIEGDLFDPDTGHGKKVAKYLSLPEISAWIQKSRVPLKNAAVLPQFMAFVSNWRGVPSRLLVQAITGLGCFSRGDMKLLLVPIVVQLTWIHNSSGNHLIVGTELPSSALSVALNLLTCATLRPPLH